ncbi:LysR substrate-binding domain-containing protein [Tardiphaga sp. 709]|uniref:LysR substrate-binding domain-containing protein n=1 Tax=Tardiphaga sp. 709 TaxID=3076039 RepID=UPI0028E399A8|nr:LysR substrate-binding domain-containing protein [Tardiphaga sp. 709]WNV11777.1 LysR substrate-binding domain-containing protein [Tardiphaga sp. 709]
MDIALLEVFRAVACEQSVTKAAERLGRVPSNVTTKIQQLEAEIGVSLFQRETKRMLLTPQGATYLDYAERILNLADEARQAVNPTRPTGTLRVGSMECSVASRLPAPLTRFNQAWPEVAIDLSTAPTRSLIDAVLGHRLDCALIAVPAGEWWLAPDALEKVPVFREQLVLLTPAGHPEVRTAQDVKPRALAAFAPGCTYRELAQNWLTENGGTAAGLTFHEVKSYHAMLACTAAGACISVMPKSVVELMRHVAVETTPFTTVDTYLACRPGFATPAFQAFRDILLESSNIASNNDQPPGSGSHSVVKHNSKLSSSL